MISGKIVGIIIIIVIVSAGIVVYASTQLMSNPNPPMNSNSPLSPSPTITSNQQTNTPQTTTSSSASPAYTSTPQTTATTLPSAEMVDGFSVSKGAYANYINKVYNTTTNSLLLENRFEIRAEEGNYKETPCWLIIQTATPNLELKYSLNPDLNWSTVDLLSKEIRTYYLAKGNLSLVYYTIETFLLKDGVESSVVSGPNKYLTFPEKGPGNTMVVGCPSNNLGTVSYETITVSAGTFSNCPKMQYPNEPGYACYSFKIPFWGLVKAEGKGTTNDQLALTELTSYKN